MLPALEQLSSGNVGQVHNNYDYNSLVDRGLLGTFFLTPLQSAQSSGFTLSRICLDSIKIFLGEWFICSLYPLPHIKPEYWSDCRGFAKKVVFEAFSGVINRTINHIARLGYHGSILMNLNKTGAVTAIIIASLPSISYLGYFLL